MKNSPAINTQSNPTDIHVMVITDFDETYGKVESYLSGENKIKVFQQKLCVEAVTTFRQHGLDVVIMDTSDANTSWPVTITRLRKIDVHAMIILVSNYQSSDRPGSKMKGFERGVAEYFDFPSLRAGKIEIDKFKHVFVRTIKALSASRREFGPTDQPIGLPIKRDERLRQARLKAAEPIPIKLRPYQTVIPKIIAVASSTGGLRALIGFFGGLPRSINCPVVVTQHMLKGFITSLAEGITKNTDWPCIEAVDGQQLKPGHVYMAPHDNHMTFIADTPYPKIKLSDAPPENYCKPAADPMFRSIASVSGSKVLGVVLTGMGNDGHKGAEEILKQGGNIIAQDQETSVVWGMPRSVAEAGLCAAVLPIDALPGEVAHLVQGKFKKR